MSRERVFNKAVVMLQSSLYAALNCFGQLNLRCETVTGSTTGSSKYRWIFKEDITNHFGFGMNEPWEVTLLMI